MPTPINTADFKNRDAHSYDSLTAEFERFTTLMTEPLAARLVGLAGVGHRDRVLDVGTGTGIVAIRAAERPDFQGKVIGVDLSPAMLSLAQTKALSADLGGRVEFSCMDAEHLEFQNSSFDSVLSLFALLHFPNPSAALLEMHRVLRPGGRLAIAIGSGPKWFSRAAYCETIRFMRRAIAVHRGKLLVAPHALDNFVKSRIAKRETEESSLAQQRRKRAGNVVRLVREAGFREIHTEWLGTEAAIGSPEEFWEIQRTFSSIARKRLLGLDENEIELLFSDFSAMCRNVLARGGKLVYPFAALYVLGCRPAT